MFRSPALSVTVLLLTLSGGARFAAADAIVFSNLGPGNSFDTSTGQLLSYETFLGETRIEGVAGAFVPSSNVQLGSVSIAVQAPLDFTVDVTQDQDFSIFGGTDGPGAVLESFDVPAQTSPGVVTLTSVLNPTLIAGDTYWIYILPNADWDSTITAPITGTWFSNNQSNTGMVSVNDEFCKLPCAPFTQSEIMPAFEVTSFTPSSSTPEPATSWLIFAGALVLAVLRRYHDSFQWQRRLCMELNPPAGIQPGPPAPPVGLASSSPSGRTEQARPRRGPTKSGRPALRAPVPM